MNIYSYRWKYFQNFGCDFREEYDVDSEIENLLDKPMDSPIKRRETNLSTNQKFSKLDIIKDAIRNRRFSKRMFGKLGKLNNINTV